MNAYENLANAIIQQAVTDYRLALKYLKLHPRTSELEETVSLQIAQRKKRQEERKKKGLPKVKEKKSREELLLEKITDCKIERDEIRRFFRSGWFTTLTSVDGGMLLKKLDEEAEKL